MLLPRSYRAMVAGFGVGFVVLLVGVACRPDQPVVPPSAAEDAPRSNSLPAANPDSIGIHYLCENRFRIRNRNNVEVAVQWVVVGTSDSGTVVLAARQSGTSFSETYVDMPDSGTVRLFVGGVRIAAAENTGGACGIRRLTVRLEPGVIASPAAFDTAYPVGTAVSYSFAPAPGYRNVLVALDDSLVPASGSVVMGTGHLLWAAADLDVELPLATDPLVVELHGLLTAEDPVSTYQQILDDVGALFDAVGPDEASRRMKLAGLVAYDPIRDSAALVRVDDALALHEFTVGSGEYDGSGASGGPVIIADRSPSGALREAAPGSGCFLQRPPEVPGSSEPTRVVYINGIRTTFDEAATTTRGLDCALVQSGQLSGSRYTVRMFYNRTWSVQLPEDVRKAFWCVFAGVRWQSQWSFLARIVGYSACATQAAVTAIRTQDYLEAFSQFAKVQAGSPGLSEDADSLARYFAGVRAHDGEHVIVVAHSQGNLITQQAVQALRDRGLYAPRADSLCLAAVAVAAPTSSNWPIPDDHLLGLQVPGDLLSLLTHRNHFPTISTSYSDSTQALVELIRSQLAGATDPGQRLALVQMANLVRWSHGVRLHSMDETYLGEQPARDAITNDVATLHRQCTIGQLALDPASVTLRVQSSTPLAVSATNRNSLPLLLKRNVSWIIPPIVALSRNERRVTATSPGAGEITARVFDREAREAIQVPMEALVVSATQTPRSSWKLDEWNAPPDYPPPDVGPPPAWDGIPSKCTGVKILSARDSVLNVTYTWAYVAHCWYAASGTVQPPDGIHIARYRWRWFDSAGVERISPTNQLTAYSVQDMPADEPLAPFSGWGRLEVWGLNASDVPIAKGTACISNCGGTP